MSGPFQPLECHIQRSDCLVTDGDQRLLARTLWQNAEAERGEIGRSLVVACLDNDLDGIALYLSLVYGDSVPMIFPGGSNTDLLGQVLSRFRPNFLILAKADVPEGFCFAFHWGRYHVFAARQQVQHAFIDGLCLLATTSGSTGSPKVVRQSTANIAVNTQQIIDALGLTAQDTAITSLPISYTFGMSTVNCQIFTGGPLVATPYAVTQKETLQLLQSENVSVFSGVPQTYEQLARMRFFKSRYVGSIKTFLQAGGKMNGQLASSLRRALANSSANFHVMYGQAEATTRISILPTPDFYNQSGSVGVPLNGGSIDIVDEHGDRVPQGAEGEILYRGENVALGYAEEAADLSEPDEFRGQVRTGDIGYLDERGYLFITGRLKRMAKVNGQSLNLSHLEVLLEEAFDTYSTCVELDERIHIATSVQLNQTDVENVLEKQTRLTFRDIQLHHVAQLPQTSTGKTDYRALGVLLLAS